MKMPRLQPSGYAPKKTGREKPKDKKETLIDRHKLERINYEEVHFN